MCGIAGYIQRVDDGVDHLGAMMRRISHRGPDGRGVWASTHNEWTIRLGHCRLAILDLAGGAQPMSDRPGSLHITFNGEIYNFQELRESLERAGCCFHTRSDTEVILNHFAQCGTGGLSQFNGMFAFAIWDQVAATLTLARDRIGIKPLYYAHLSDGGLVFASELTAVLAHSGIRANLNPDAVASLLFRDYIPAPQTIVSSVHKLEPGHFIQWRPSGIGEPTAYWRLQPQDTRHEKPRRLASKLRERVLDSVRAQLVADVPVGVFLSGGVDSSLVAAAAQMQRDRSISTFSIGFDDPEFDESSFARQVAHHIGSDHHEQRFSEAELFDVFDDALSCLDEPMADPSILPTFLLSRFAARHVKVVLGGDGGDELWAGYPTYKAHRAARIYQFIPKSMRRAMVEPVVSRLPVSHGYQRLDWKLKRFVLRWEDDPIRRHQHWMSSAAPDELASVMPSNAPPWLASSSNGGFDGDALNEILAFDLASYLPGSVLAKVDRASMAHGLEVRPPLLDNGLIDFAFSIPSSLKQRGGRSKWLLKRAATGLIPASVIRRRKRGFAIPLASWIATSLRPRIEQMSHDSPVWASGLLCRESALRWIDEHARRRRDHSRPLWALLVLDHWMRRVRI